MSWPTLRFPGLVAVRLPVAPLVGQLSWVPMLDTSAPETPVLVKPVQMTLIPVGALWLRELMRPNTPISRTLFRVVVMDGALTDPCTVSTAPDDALTGAVVSTPLKAAMPPA